MKQIFNYNDMAEDLFGTDTADYNDNTAFADGFDISADGSRMILGTKIFKLAAGDMTRGDAIAVDGTDFYNIGDYAVGNQPFATYVDGDFLPYSGESSTLIWVMMRLMCTLFRLALVVPRR